MRLCCQFGARLLLPNLECGGTGSALAVGLHSMASGSEMSIDECMCRLEARGVPGRLETLHLPLPTPSWSMRVLSSVVQIAALPVFCVG